MRPGRSLAALAIAAAACSLPAAPRDIPYGFARGSARSQLDLERQFLSLPDRARIEAAHRELTRLPHPAGSVRDRELAQWTAKQFRDSGLQDVALTTHEVMLPQPIDIRLQMIHPRPWDLPQHEKPVSDPDTQRDPRASGLPHHAFSASGEVTAPIVYAGRGAPRDYDWLAAHGVDVRGTIALVRNSVPYSYRGFKAFVAQQRGAAGILMYSDPADDGGARGPAYPDGPWGPDSRIERGSIAYDFLIPGDPLTPGWPSLPGARRIAREKAVSLPAILSAPISSEDARPIFEALGGPAAPRDWQGALPISYRIGPGPARVRMTIRMDDAVRPVWTVTGRFPGTDTPDEVVIVGNHRDAWVYGGVDPSSGSAALVELARTLGVLAAEGWRPKRSIVFASWDAEELALTSSTEWAEQHEAWLRDRAVAYLNVDSAASGSQFVAGAVPSLTRLLTEVAQAVRDPVARVPISTVVRDRARAQGAAGPGDSGGTVIDDRLGGGSDYVPFLNFLGIPVADLAFDGPQGVYHSTYDTHGFVSRFADPGFRYHAALVQVWGLAALRLAQADALPLDPEASASRIGQYIRDAKGRLSESAGAPALTDLEAAAANLRNVASAFVRARERALDGGQTDALRAMNRQITGFERGFLDPVGLRGRPWYRHLVYAPRFSYEPQTLPALNDAIESGDPRRVLEEADRLAAALGRAAARLQGW